MSAHINDDLLGASTRVMLGGWWPSSAIQLSEVETFLRQGVIPQIPADTAQPLYEALSISSVQRVAGPIPSLLASTTGGIELWYSTDGLYICSMIQDSIGRAHETLQSFIEHCWLPALTAVCRQDAPLSQPCPSPIGQPTLIQITTAEPQLFTLAPIFGPAISYVQQPDMVVQSTSDYLFIITSAEAQEDGWWLGQWWIFMAAFQAEQSQSLAAHRRLWQSLTLIEQRRTLPMAKASGLRARLGQWQKEVDTHIYRLEQLCDYIDLRLTTVGTMTAGQALPQLPTDWAAETRQSHDYLLTGWSMAGQRLAQWQTSLHTLEDQAHNFNLTLLRAIITLLVTGLFLSWLHNLVLPEVALTWFPSTLIVLVVSLTFHLIITMIYSHRQYRLFDSRPIQPKTKRPR